ncbi:O-antigen ligase family protein [Winogradskyella sediminis]|uniref:O-antigen ligase family protein n=1 Tax=Winogradskyella sediminis TaxID=1382466 RepID=UPI003AA9D14E
MAILGGMAGGFIVAAVLCLPLLFINNKVLKIETLFALFIIIFFLGDNFKGPLGFAPNLRFVILGISLIILIRFQLLKENEAKYILPFSIIATGITYAFSPLGVEAILRGVSYFLMALVVFKLVQLLVEHDAPRFYNLIVIVLAFYFCLNIIVFFIPFLGETHIKGRFMGLMGNPNGLAMVAMFSYAIIYVLKRLKQTSFSPLFFRGFKILLIGLIILTGSRTGLFSLVAYELIIRLLKYKFLLAIILVLITYIYGASATLSPQAIVESLGLSAYLRTESIEDASGRTEVWVVAVEEIKNQPWLGKGMLYDGYFINYYADRFIGENRARHWYGIWNSYLSLLLNVGIIGVLAFAFFWYKMYVHSQMKIIRLAFLILCLFSAISESWMAASMNAFMPLVFLCWGLQIYQPKVKTDKL